MPATVAAGVYSGWNAHSFMDGGTRLSGIAFWGVMVFGLEALLFVLLGLQAPQLADELDIGELALQALAVALTVVAVRMAWADPGRRPRREAARADRRRLGRDRGAISLAAALAVPIEVDERPEILLLTFGVIAVTLLGQGLTLAPLMRALGCRARTVLPRQGDGAARGRAGRARPARRARGGGRRRGAAAAPARALPHALRDLRRRARGTASCPRTGAWSCASTARCGAS